MKLLAVDGNSIMNRAFYGIKLLSNSKGRFTNAVTGFMNIYLKEVAAVSPDHVAVAFDLKAPTFRHKASAAYKANRKGMPEELAEQMPVIKELLTDLGIKVVTCEGYEADDILGTLSRIAENAGGECCIVTGDRDSYQLMSGRDLVNLRELANIALEYGYKIRLRGSCDSATASSSYNQTLSENRCRRVMAELLEMGVPENQIILMPVGGVKHLDPTEYDRRVLVELVKVL